MSCGTRDHASASSRFVVISAILAASTPPFDCWNNFWLARFFFAVPSIFRRLNFCMRYALLNGARYHHLDARIVDFFRRSAH